jgi:perosamine synthetase
MRGQFAESSAMASGGKVRIEGTKNHIKLFDPVMQVDSILREVKEVLESGWIGQGKKTEQFESMFSDYVGCKYSIAVNSCTSALHLALLAAGVKANHHVLTTPMTFISTNAAILYCGAKPIFCDVDQNLHIKFEDIENFCTKKTKAIIVMHYGGLPLLMDEIYQFAKERGIWVIEDAAHACGASYVNGVKVGANYFDKGLTCFSFHAVKNLPMGDGGMVTTNLDWMADRMKKLRWLGIDKSTYSRTKGKRYDWMYEVDELGYKYHINDLTAVIGIEQLKCLDAANDYRRKLVERYRQCLPPAVRTIGDINDDRVSANHLFVVTVSNRDKLREVLQSKGITTGVHYFPNHMYKIFNKYIDRRLLNSTASWKRIISLPLHLGMSLNDVERVCDIVNKEIHYGTFEI